MRSIKPGRGPSGMSFIGSAIAIVFGLFWTIIAFNMTSLMSIGVMGMIFPFFGILFIVFGIIQAIYHYKNATGKNRFSMFDITNSKEEGDPSNKWTVNEGRHARSYEPHMDHTDATDTGGGYNYCPYCGFGLKDNYRFCPNCGKDID